MATRRELLLARAQELGLDASTASGTTVEDVPQPTDQRRELLLARAQELGLDTGAATPQQQGSILNPLAQGATLGFADELAAGGAALIGKVLPESMGGLPAGTDIVDAFKGIRGDIQQAGEAFAEREPGAALAAEVAGGLVTGGLGAAKAIPALAGSLGKTGAVAATGAAEGALVGAGTGDTLEERIQGAAAGAVVGAVIGTAGKKAFDKINKNKSQIAAQLGEGSTDADVAGFKLVKGRAVKDKIAQAAIDDGNSPRWVSAAKSANPETMKKLAKQIEIKERGIVNLASERKFRPSDVAGESVLARVRHLNKVKTNAGKELDGVANSLKGKTVDFSDPISNFAADLERQGVTVGDDFIVDFGESVIGEKASLRKLVNDVVKRTKKLSDTGDAFRGHTLKRSIDQLVDFGKQKGGITGQLERTLKNLRKDTDGLLDSNFSEYDRVNTAFSETKGAIDELQKLAGKIDIVNDKGARKAVGTLLRRTTSNAQSRVPLENAIDVIEDLTAKHGGKFKDDLGLQIDTVNMLDDLFGASAKTSIKGDLGDFALEAATGTSGVGLARKAARLGIGGKEKVITDDSIKSLKRLVNR